MSQVSIIDIEGSHPQIPTEFITNFGNAIPIANQLEILGTHIAAGVIPVYTTGAGNVVTVNVQLSQALASTDVTRAGISSFDSSAFTVDANGFVSLIGGGTGIESVATNVSGPITANGSGQISILGTITGPTGSPLHTTGAVASTVSVVAQAASAQVGSGLNNAGMSSYNSSQFTVDANGFVSLIGGSLAIDSIGVQTGTSPIVPTVAGLVTINGAVVAAGTNPIRTDGTGANTMAVEVQISQAIAVADATKIGLSNYNSSHFSVDANGFVSSKSGGFSWTDVTGATQTLAAQNGYVTDRGGGVTYTLPASGTLGDTIKIVGKLGIAVITPNANQQILNGSTSGTVGVTGTATANNVGDCIELICITAGASTVWRANAVIGTWTLA